MGEKIWRKHPDFPNYSVSNEGDIRNDLKHKIMHWAPGPRGEARICLFHNGVGKFFQVSRLVAEVHLPNFNPDNFVRFKDGDRNNLHVDNLDNTQFGAH